MSTEHDTEHDTEYGPTPPEALHEHTDIDPGIGYRFAVWLTVAMIASVGIVYGAFWLFEGQKEARDTAAQLFPLAAGQDKEAPAPRLQAAMAWSAPISSQWSIAVVKRCLASWAAGSFPSATGGMTQLPSWALRACDTL